MVLVLLHNNQYRISTIPQSLSFWFDWLLQEQDAVRGMPGFGRRRRRAGHRPPGRCLEAARRLERQQGRRVPCPAPGRPLRQRRLLGLAHDQRPSLS